MKTITSIFTLALLLLCLSVDAAFYQFNRWTTNLDGTLQNGATITNLANPIALINATTLTLSNPLRGDQVQFAPGANITLTTNGSGGVTIVGSSSGSSTNGNFTNATFYSTGPPAVTITGGTSNWLGGITVATNIATILQTNFISGKLYTNATGRNQTVYSSVFLTCSAANGAANMLIQEDFTGNTTVATVASCVVGTTVTSIADNYIFQVTADVVPGGVYCFTNTSTGSGNATSLQSGTGFIRTY